MHEGLGSVSMWRDFPDQLCAATGCRGLVFSRPGYGRSTAREPGERWGADFMHRQAHEMLPALFAAVGLDPVATPPWLFGHSDGGSIALLHAAQESRAGSLARVVRVAGAIVVAPHIFVEEVAITSIEAARQAYLEGGLRQALSRHHDDPDSAFWGWNDAWLAPSFRGWSIESELAAITCPLLAVQGLDDEYGSLAQIRGIAQRLPHTHLLELAECGHSPHRDQPGRLIAGVANFMAA
ncbi:MAG: alpha/beta hydrolase [Chitinophagaceae bacterium]|nr:alpha/beta hydrolase [Rubrivivax sp.]